MSTIVARCKFCHHPIRKDVTGSGIVYGISHAEKCAGSKLANLWDCAEDIPDRAKIEDSPAYRTKILEVRFNSRMRKLYIMPYKTLVVGNFCAAHLEEGDGYVIVDDAKILLSKSQIAKLTEEI